MVNNGEIMKNITAGMKIVGYDFNPSKNVTIDKLKLLFAEAIDEMLLLKIDGNDEIQNMIIEEAIAKILDAQMWSVKGVSTTINKE